MEWTPMRFGREARSSLMLGSPLMLTMGCTGQSQLQAENTAIIKQMYGDVIAQRSFQPIVDTFAEDGIIRVTIPRDTSVGGEFRGKEGLQTYLTRVEEVFAPEEIRLDDFIGRNDKVFVFGFERARIKPTGATLESEWTGIFTLSNRKITYALFIEDMSELTAALRR